MPRTASACAALLAGAAALGAACDRCAPAEPQPGAAANTQAAEVDGLLARLGDALCATEKRCDPRPRARCRWPEVLSTPGPLGAWAGAAAVRAARARVDAAAFAACEKAVREAPCERVLRIFADVSVPLPYLENDACRDLYDGGSADGEPCCADEECAGGACARESAASGADGGARVSRCAKAQIRPGTVRTAAEGQACDPTGEPMCPAAQTCLRKPEGGRACAAWRARAADEPCQDSTDCAAPLVCGPQYRCAPKAGEGASCCPEGESCSPAFCRDDLRCDFEARACAPRLPSGAACPELVERACAEGFVCRAGRCAAPAASLAECRSHGECAAGWACAGGRCAPRGEAGAACADDPECREGLVCNPFSPRVCVPPSAPLLCESG